MSDGASNIVRLDRWSGDLLDGQMVIKTVTTRDYEASDEAAECGSEFGYWIHRYHKADRSYELIAKFVTQEAVEAFESSLSMPVIYWPEDAS